MFFKEFSLEVTSEIDWGLRRSRERRSLLQVHKPAKVLSELSAFLLGISSSSVNVELLKSVAAWYHFSECECEIEIL